MSEIKTEWFPPDVCPIHEGQYEIQTKAVFGVGSPLEDVAMWERHHGQLGFWHVVKTNTGHVVSNRIIVIGWRGRLLAPRVKLQLELNLPRRRVALS